MESKVTANHLRVKASAGSSPALSAITMYFDWDKEWVRDPACTCDFGMGCIGECLRK